MAMVDGDWTIDRATGDIRYIGDDHVRFGGTTPSYATVIEFHRWLQDFADQEVSSGDDELDITDLTPSERSTDNIITLKNGFNITANDAEHLYDGSIIQGSGGTEEYYDGIVNFGDSTVLIQLIQNGTVITDDWWNLSGGGGVNADTNNGISHRFMVKTRTAGADVDGRRLIGISRTYGKTFSEFKINGTSRGNNVLALTQADDLNNITANATVSAWTTITNNNEGYTALDVDADGSDEHYYSEWDIDTANHDINDFYERMKYLSQDGSAETIYGLSGELFRGITHEIAVTPNTVNSWTEPESVTWNTGSGQMLAIDSTSAPTKMWIQILTGTAPTSGTVITGGSSSSTADSGTVTSREPVDTPFCGASTGSAIIGAYGLGIIASQLTSSDKLTDLTANVITPPNNVTFQVLGLVSGDRVLVTNDQSSGIDYDQMTLQAALNGAAETTANVGTGNIPADTPSSGTIRIETDAGRYLRVAYDSYNTSHFTFNSSQDFSGVNVAAATNNVFISYIDEAATSNTSQFTTVYDADRTLFIRVRDGGGTPIKTFETTGTLGSSGGSSTAIRTSDE